jgi:hypothetical protein
MDLIIDRKSHNPGISTTLSNPPAVLQKANDASQAENIEAQQIEMESFVVYCAEKSVRGAKGVRPKEVHDRVSKHFDVYPHAKYDQKCLEWIKSVIKKHEASGNIANACALAQTLPCAKVRFIRKKVSDMSSYSPVPKGQRMRAVQATLSVGTLPSVKGKPMELISPSVFGDSALTIMDRYHCDDRKWAHRLNWMPVVLASPQLTEFGYRANAVASRHPQSGCGWAHLYETEGGEMRVLRSGHPDCSWSEFMLHHDKKNK